MVKNLIFLPPKIIPPIDVTYEKNKNVLKNPTSPKCGTFHCLPESTLFLFILVYPPLTNFLGLGFFSLKKPKNIAPAI
jgi:hypothetical protein